MQLGGIGSEHSTHSHQVTDCLNGHAKRQEGELSAVKAGARTEQLQQQLRQDTQLSFVAWVQNTLNKGKTAWKGVWGTGVSAGGSSAGQQSDGGQTAQQAAGVEAVSQTAALQNTGLPRTEHTAAAEAAGAVAQSAHAAAQQPDNPYFQPLEQDGDFMITPAQRLRLRIKETTRQLADHLSGRFFGSQNKNFLQTKQEQAKEDLRKRSRYKKDETEIDCILTDESYLMDSYDRRGEYRQLTTKK